MIEDKKLGIKIAESPKEEFWGRMKQNSEVEIKNLERDLDNIPMLIKFHKEVIKLCRRKLR